MSIMINKDKCVGCGKCIAICPGNLIAKDEDRKAYIRFPKDCWGCTSCLKECRVDAILYFLGADIGGLGSTLSYKEQGDMVTWSVTTPTGDISRIEIDKRQSNKY